MQEAASRGGAVLDVTAADAHGRPAAAGARRAGGYGAPRVEEALSGARAYPGLRTCAVALDVGVAPAPGSRCEHRWRVGRVERRARGGRWERVDHGLRALGADGAREGARRKYVLVVALDPRGAGEEEKLRVRLVLTERAAGGAEPARRRSGSFSLRVRPTVLLAPDVERLLGDAARPRPFLCPPPFVASCFCRPDSTTCALDDGVAYDARTEASCYCVAASCGALECYALACASVGTEQHSSLLCLRPCGLRRALPYDGGFRDDVFRQLLLEQDYAGMCMQLLGYLVCAGMCCSQLEPTDLSYHRWRGGELRLRDAGAGARYAARGGGGDDGDDDDDEDDRPSGTEGRRVSFAVDGDEEDEEEARREELEVRVRVVEREEGEGSAQMQEPPVQTMRDEGR